MRNEHIRTEREQLAKSLAIANAAACYLGYGGIITLIRTAELMLQSQQSAEPEAHTAPPDEETEKFLSTGMG